MTAFWPTFLPVKIWKGTACQQCSINPTSTLAGIEVGFLEHKYHVVPLQIFACKKVGQQAVMTAVCVLCSHSVPIPNESNLNWIF